MRYRRFACVVVAVFGIVISAVGQSSQRGWIALEQDAPRQARGAAILGPKAPTDVVHVSLALPYGDPVGMQQFVDSVSNPASPDYRKFLTPEQIGSRFGLPVAAVKKVSDYLAAQGMKIRVVGKNRLSILADATVAQAEKAFNVAIQEYAVGLPGQTTQAIRFSTAGPPSVPSEIGAFVQYIGGLEDFVRPVPLAETPDQFRQLYSVAPLYSSGFQGLGRTVGISNWTTYGSFNIPLEYKQWNLPTPAGGLGSNFQVVSIDGDNGEVSGASQVECDIDIQTVFAMAPLCTVILYDNANNSDIIGVLTQEAEDNKADVITESYAWNGPTPMFTAAHNLHLAMSAQGITYLCASGDWGSQGMANLYYPDEDPDVLTVGGTSVSTDAAGNRLSEVVWGGSGGGWVPNSDAFNVPPAYQKLPAFLKGTGVPSNIPYRLVPDIALDADPGTGYEVFIGGGLQIGWGGTSCASPTAAGALAACEEMIIANGGLPADGAGHQRFGRIQDLLYSMNGDPTVFNDIASGGNGTLPNGAGSNATPGWDTATGWGTIIFSGLAARVLNFPPIASVTISSSSTVGGNSLIGTVSLASPAGPSGVVVTLASNNTAANIPGSVLVAKGAKTASFTVTTTAVSASSTATITATFAGSTQSTVLTVMPAGLKALTISPSSVVGGNSATATVTLNGIAGPNGAVVNVASAGTAVTVPTSVKIAAGALTGSFSISTSGVISTISQTVTASSSGNSVNASLTITPASLASISVSPNPVIGGIPATGTITLNGFAPPSGVVVALSGVAATVPLSVQIAGGTSSVTFAVATKPVGTSVAGKLTAKSGLETQTASFSIVPSSLAGLVISPTTVVGGSTTSVTGMLTFSGPAPPAGELVTLTSSNIKAAIVPASVRVANGLSSATFRVTQKKVAASTTVIVTATWGKTSKTANLMVTP